MENKFSNLYEKLEKLTQIDRPVGIIQWKGTDVCLDIHCNCGYHSHIDDDFVYYFECSNCSRLYALGNYIKLIELNNEEKELVEKECEGLIKTDEHPNSSHEESFDFESKEETK